MSKESFPGSANPTETVVDNATIDEINSIAPLEVREISPLAAKVQRTADRVAGFLEKRAINTAHAEALTDNQAIDAETQDAAYATYEDNLDASSAIDQARRRDARAEKISDAKATLKTWGRLTLKKARLGWESAKSGAETTVLFAMITADKAKAAAGNARVRAAERAAYREDTARKIIDQEDAFASYDQNIAFTQDREAQDEAFSSYEENVAYSGAHEEALEMNAQKKADQAAAIDSYSENIDATAQREAREKAEEEHVAQLHGEALDMNAEFDENAAREAAIKLAYAARLAKLRRQQLRQERIDRTVDTASATWQTAKKLSKRFGRAIGRFTVRGARVAAGTIRGAANGARASYQQTAK